MQRTERVCPSRRSVPTNRLSAARRARSSASRRVRSTSARSTRISAASIQLRAIDTQGSRATGTILGAAAGALIGPDTLAKAHNAGLNPRDYLDDHDSYSLFDATDSLIRTGPTLTNVNDFRAVLVVPAG